MYSHVTRSVQNVIAMWSFANLCTCTCCTVEPELTVTWLYKPDFWSMPVSKESPKQSQYITGSLHKQVTQCITARKYCSKGDVPLYTLLKKLISTQKGISELHSLTLPQLFLRIPFCMSCLPCLFSFLSNALNHFVLLCQVQSWVC